MCIEESIVILISAGGKKENVMSTFLTYDERLEIETGLKKGLSFGAIGNKLGKDRTTVAKEVKKYSYDQKSGYPGWPYNACKNRFNCLERNLCSKDDCRRPSTHFCKYCSYCNAACSRFEEKLCSMRNKPPYVCNGCADLCRCTLKKKIYNAYDAHTAFSKKISEARSGILSNEKELSRLDALISPLIKKGHSIHQIYINHADELMCSEKTVYNYVDACLFEVRNIDLPRKVRYRPRSKKPEFKIDRGCRNGRTYDDFKAFMTEHPDTPVVQMDSVIGNRGGKVLLTMHFVETSLMLAFLRDANTSQSVIDVFHDLRKKLGFSRFQKLFPVILTDNGSEFSNPKAIENGPDGLSQTRIYYCDPSCPYQKGAIEVNHELVRRIIPKGHSMDVLTQEDICRMMDHVNSYKRKKLNNMSPYQVFSFYYGEELLQLLGCSPVPPEDIILKPELLKK